MSTKNSEVFVNGSYFKSAIGALLARHCRRAAQLTVGGIHSLAPRAGGLAFIALCMLPSVATFGDETQPTPNKELRVMSFNIRYGTARDGENHWDKRKDFVAETIKVFDPDLLGTQETLGFQKEFLQKKLPGYTSLGVGRDDGKTTGEMTAIFFRTERFEKLAEGHFWLSKTPEQPGSKSWDSSLPRICSWVKLRDRESDAKPILLLNTHFDHRGRQARNESAKLIRSQVKKLGADCDAIITGDFNATVGSDPYKTLFDGKDSKLPQLRLVDTYKAASTISTLGEATFSGFRAGPVVGGRIDWIAASAGWKVVRAGIDRTTRDGRTPSDHYPVTATLQRTPSAGAKLKHATKTANGWSRLAPAKYFQFDNLAFGFDPDNSRTMYLVSRGGDKRHGKAPEAGFWKSVDGGKTWVQKSNKAGHSTNGGKSLLISPHDSNVIYAASEYSPHLMVSRNKGETWTGLSESIHHGISIAIDPDDKDRIWIGADDSIHTSPDGGKTWIALTEHGLPVRVKEKHTLATVHGLFTDRDDSNILYAGFYSADAAHEAGVYKSDNRGKSWKASNKGMRVTPVPPKVNFLRNESLFALAQSPSQPKTLYAATVWSYLYRTDDGAETWQEMHTGGQKSGIPWLVKNPKTGESTRFDTSIRELAIHPTDPNVIVAGTGLCSAIYSKDGGRNWIDLGCSLPTKISEDGTITVTYPDGTTQTNKKPYPLFGGGDGWASDVRFHPDDPSRVYFANTYGIFTKTLVE